MFALWPIRVSYIDGCVCELSKFDVMYGRVKKAVATMQTIIWEKRKKIGCKFKSWKMREGLGLKMFIISHSLVKRSHISPFFDWLP